LPPKIQSQPRLSDSCTNTGAEQPRRRNQFSCEIIFDSARINWHGAKVSGIPDATIALAANPAFPNFLLWVIRSYFEVGKKDRLPCRLLAAAIRFNRYEYRINLVQRFLVSRLCDPAPLRGV